MAMELQLSTAKAQAEVTAMNALLGQLQAQLTAVGANTGVAATGLANISANARSAATGIGTINTNLNAANASMKNFNANAANAAKGMGSFTSGLSSANGLLSAFGLSLGAAGFAKFAKTGYDMVNVFESFKTVVGATSGGVKVADAELAHITATAKRLKIDVETTTAAYGKFIAAQSAAGQEVAVSRDQFTKLSEVFRVMNLSADKTKLAFLAVEQMVSKGSISMEELRRQLGESVPAFGALAEAMGVSTGELSKMISEGKVITADALPKLIEQLHKVYVNAESMSRALGKPAAVMTDLANGVKILAYEFYKAFHESTITAITNFSDRLDSKPVKELAAAFGQLAAIIAGALANAIGGVISTFEFLSSTIGAFPTAVLATAAAFLFLIGPITAATRAIGLFTGVGLAMSVIGPVLKAIGAGFTILGLTVAKSIIAMGPIGRLLTLAAIAATLGATAFGLFSNEAQGAEAGAQGLDQKLEDANATLKDAKNASGSAGGGLNILESITQGVTGAQGGMTGALNSATGAMNSQASAAGSLASALANLNSAKAGSGGAWSPVQNDLSNYPVMSGNDLYNTPNTTENQYDPMTGLPVYEQPEMPGEYAMGGYSHGPAMSYRPVRSGRFNAAPKFQTGGDTSNYASSVPGGGIPAVLHPNEAVVPLPSGGAIPVQMGGAMSSLAGYAKEQCTILKNINQKLSVNTDAIVANGVIIKTEADRAYDCLQRIEGLLFKQLEAMAKLAVSGGGYGGGGGGGGVGGGSYGGEGLPSDFYEGIMPMAGQGYQPGQLGFTGEDGSIYAQSKMAHVSSKYLLPGGRGLKPEYAHLAKYLVGGGRGRFAEGSPNASKDVDGQGGFMAMLHPDEAVIPLPDGRSVPVDLGLTGQRLMDMMMQTSTEINGGPDGKGFGKFKKSSFDKPSGGVLIENITIKIVTPDVGSFNRSSDQIVRELERSIRRSMNRLGKETTFDDPTKLPGE